MRLDEIFAGIEAARVGVIGDFCLDVYWLADMKRSELSRETPHFPLPIINERMQPGGAGNVACNLAALKPKSVRAFGVIGTDWRGSELKAQLQNAGVDASGLIARPERVTNAYVKPLRSGISDTVYEDPRLDFENYAPLAPEAENELIRLVSEARLDVLCVCDQMRMGCVTPAVRERVCQLNATVIADSRDRIALYHDVIIKPNEVEAARAAGDGLSYEEAARALSLKTRKPVIITLGCEGCLVFDRDCARRVPALRVEPPIDICGAGDTFMAALACATAAGAEMSEAALFANAASSITIKKLNATGTASREEFYSSAEISALFR